MGLVNDLPGMAYRCRNDRDWTMIFVSSGAEDLTGFRPSVFKKDGGVPYGSLIHPEDRARVWLSVQRSLERCERFSISYRIHTAEGQTKWVWEQGRVVPAPDGAIDYVEGFIIDVTDRTVAEEGFRRMFLAAPLGILLFETDGAEGLVLRDTNPAASKIFDEDIALLRGRPIEDALPGLGDSEILSVWRDLAEQGGTWSDDQVIYHADGVTGVFSVKAFQTFPGRVAAMFEDVTELREHEHELRRLSSAVHQAAGSVVITDVEGAIEYVNPAFEKLTGYDREEILGEDIRNLDSGQREEASYRTVWKELGRGKVWQGTLVNRAKDGSLFREEATICPVEDGSGSIANFLAVGRDLTREVELEQQVRQAQRLESVGRLAGGVAHDFNNVLTAVLGSADFALAALDRGEMPSRGDLETIRSSAERAAELTKQLLAVSRKQPLQFRETDVNQAVDGVCRLISRTTPATIDLVVELEEKLWPVSGDAGQLEQVFLNLVVNAIDAMPDGGRLSIATENARVDGSYAERHFDVTAGEYVALTVTDTGVGMDEAIRDHLFEPFFTTKSEDEGTGLGLATAYGIISQHDGHMWVYSEPGVGSTFKVYLPRRPAELNEVDPIPPVTGEVENAFDRSGPVPTVLVVDDNEDVLALAARHLRERGLRTLEANHPEKAIELLNRDVDVDLLLTDTIMPTLTGHELAARFLELYPEGRVLLMSGHPDSSARASGPIGRSASSYVAKPFTGDDLFKRVREKLDEQRRTPARLM